MYLSGECFVIRRGYETARPVSSSFCLTVPPLIYGGIIGLTTPPLRSADGAATMEPDYRAQPRITRASTKPTRANIAIDKDEEATIAA